MKTIILALLAGSLACAAHAGDDASGPIRYSADFSKPYASYNMSEKDKSWSRSLVKNLKYTRKVIHFVRTSIPLEVNGLAVEGAIYKALEEPDTFYVVNGDSMFKIGYPWPYNPGVGGFSMHAPKSQDFIVCLNFQRGGVPHLSSTPVIEGKVTWTGHDWSRL